MKLISMEPCFKSNNYIILETNKNCNYSCEYCTFKKKNLPHLKLNVLCNIIDKLSDTKTIFDLDFIGGEPTIYPNYIDILQYAAITLNKSIIYTTTNTSRSLNFFKEIINSLKTIDPNRIRFYFSYHMNYANLNEYISKVNYLTERGYQVYIKFVCDNKNFDDTKYIYSKLKESKYSKLFLKYLWNYRTDQKYSPIDLEWLKNNYNDNGYKFNISYDDGKNIISKYMNYSEIKEYGFDVLKNYYCYVNRLLFIDIYGNVYPSCLKHTMTKPLINIHTSHIDKVFDKSNVLQKCQLNECTELFNNPYKFFYKEENNER